MILRGFIDESYDEHIFVLSSLVAVGTEWRWISRDWLACSARWNEKLRSLGRPLISRFHASELNSLDNEYKGWTREEQIGYISDLIRVLGRWEGIHSYGIALDIDDFKGVFPDHAALPKHDMLGNVYGFMTKFLVYTLAPRFVAVDPTIRISLVHDRCEYDGVIADAFRKAIEDPAFKEANSYVSIAPGSSLEVIPLQPADLLSHENFKEAKRLYKSGKRALRKRRTSLKALIKQGNIGGGLSYIPGEALRDFKHHVINLRRKTGKQVMT